MKPPLVIYHGGCRDGFCAAWVAHKSLPDAEFFAGYYGQAPPKETGREIYIVDFSYQREVMEEMARNNTLVVLDHHKTAEAALKDLPGMDTKVVFDMDRSGAGIAWDYFNVGPRPWIVNYIEDRDLWRKALPGSDAVNAYLSTVAFDFQQWDLAARHGAEHAAHLGMVVELKVVQYVAEVRKNARRIVFEGFDIPIVNAPQVDVSELGHALAVGETFAMVWWQRADGVFQYSLRSIGDFDVSELAKRHGGGGHKNAAGFQSATLIG